MIVSYFNNTKPINIAFLSIILSILIFLSFFLTENAIFSIQNFTKWLILLFSFILFNFIVKGKLVSEKDFGILFYVLLSGIFFVSFLRSLFSFVRCVAAIVAESSSLAINTATASCG